MAPAAANKLRETVSDRHCHRTRRLFVAAALAFSLAAVVEPVAPAGIVPARAAIASTDYPPAEWVPANSNNFTVSNRPVNYQVNMIVIHDIEGSVDSAIAAFQDPNRGASAHYIVGQAGGVWQMVLEKDIAWHAGNWDYNTRAIGIEHEGYACCNLYTTAEYNTSAKLAASICSRWGVPLDRAHVIGHSEVPDPNNPGLYGGEEHHTDPGPYWDWSYYLSQARSYASSLPSPPHMGPSPIASNEEGGVMLTWQPAQSCHDPITSYTITGPNGLNMKVPATQTSVWIPGLTDGSSYQFTVTATNAEGQDGMLSRTGVPGPRCNSATVAGSPATPQPAGSSITLNATSTGCNSPRYAFWVNTPSAGWTLMRGYSSSASWTWNTTGWAPGNYEVGVWAEQAGALGDYDTYAFAGFTLNGTACATAGLSPSSPPPQAQGTQVTFTASSTGCASPQYQLWLLAPGGAWKVVQPYSATATWLFDTSKYAPGNYQVGVWARQSGSSASYEAFNVSTFIVGGAGCTVSAVTAAPAQPQPAGASVTVTAQSSGCTKQYKFWLLPPGGAWRVVQAYGAAKTWTWNTSGYGPGVYEVGAWEGSSSTPSSYESYAIASFTLTSAACGSVALSADSASPHTAGSTVSLTAAASGCASPQYQFWLLKPGGSWTVMRAYGASATWAWNTTGLPSGTYQLGVWARQSGSTASYQSYLITTAQVVVAPCASATLTPSLASPQPAGTSVTFTATSTGCASPRYQFLELAPGGGWKVVQAYSPTATFTWNGAGAAGAYSFAVWAQATGSSNDYDGYAVSNFTTT